jgi:lipoate-protein ligase A
LIDLLQEALTGIKYNKDDIKATFNELSQRHPELTAQVDDVSSWLIGEMKS